MKKRLIISGAVLLIIFLVLLIFSPYKHQPGYDSKSIQCVIDIAAPVDSVFAYLGNSANAQRWSVFVDHIIPLNPDIVPDGSIGSLRRCFRNADEKGLRWDEEIMLIEPAKSRRLSIFNMVEFPVQASGLATDQWYESLGPQQTRLTFTVFYLSGPTFWDHFKTIIMAWAIEPVFNQNMKNIKMDLENQTSR